MPPTIEREPGRRRRPGPQEPDRINGAGSGAGGGGGMLVVFCDEYEGDWPDCNGGTGGTTAGGGQVGATGAPGRVLVFVKGRLAYSSGFS